MAVEVSLLHRIRVLSGPLVVLIGGIEECLPNDILSPLSGLHSKVVEPKIQVAIILDQPFSDLSNLSATVLTFLT